MKLRNKKTGEIAYNYDIRSIQGIDMDKGINHIWLKTEDGNIYSYTSLADFNEEWEDYEEPKETALEEMIKKLESDFKMYPDEWNNLEEAKQITTKLKAWKRLSENRDLFSRLIDLIYSLNSRSGEFTKYIDDINLLFGDEE